jgi:hypothetical protein
VLQHSALLHVPTIHELLKYVCGTDAQRRQLTQAVGQPGGQVRSTFWSGHETDFLSLSAN